MTVQKYSDLMHFMATAGQKRYVEVHSRLLAQIRKWHLAERGATNYVSTYSQILVDRNSITVGAVDHVTRVVMVSPWARNV